MKIKVTAAGIVVTCEGADRRGVLKDLAYGYKFVNDNLDVNTQKPKAKKRKAAKKAMQPPKAPINSHLRQSVVDQKQQNWKDEAKSAEES